MRTSLRRSQQLLQSSSSTRRNLSTPRSRELPASRSICQACHRPLPPSSSKLQISRQRHLNSTSTSTAQSTRHSDPEPTSAPPIAKTHYDLFPLTIPHGPPPTGPFKIDPRALRREFLALQQKSHPDLFPPHLKTRAEATSSLINTAYKTLQSPLLRAQYLLSLQGIETAEDEAGRVEDPELLMEVMEAREAVEHCQTEQELEEIKEENEARVAETEGVLGERIEAGDWEGARAEAVRLRYWVNVRESIEGWEKGKGGGEIHH
ncbi:related to related molecular chaperone [Phialocephala subalpina]|uniref:Related to related molecular chaperone n=1 Tax=Phialocephala subalpina TaxID=576137 RepID=A0A1L7WMD2_9HELO|nr:related to related molecular chaperone [Phialocephala subalpina]